MKMINANKFQDFINIDNSISIARKSLAQNNKRLTPPYLMPKEMK